MAKTAEDKKLFKLVKTREDSEELQKALTKPGELETQRLMKLSVDKHKVICIKGKLELFRQITWFKINSSDSEKEARHHCGQLSEDLSSVCSYTLNK